MSAMTKPAWWPVVVWPVLLFVVMGLVATLLVSDFVKALSVDGRMVAPGSMEVELEEAGSYHVWFYMSGEGDDGERYDAAGSSRGESIVVEDLGSGARLAVTEETMETSNDLMGPQAYSAGVFVMGGPGRVRVTVEGGPERLVEVSQLDLVGASNKLGQGLFVVVLGGILALVLLAVLLIVRARRVAVWAATVPPPVA